MNYFMNVTGIFGDSGPFQMLDFFGDLGMTGQKREKKEEINYLQKGEKILSLLREKKPKAFYKDNTLECVKWCWKQTWATAMRRVGARLEESFIEELQGADEEEGSQLESACSKLVQQLPEGVLVEPEEGTRQLRLMDVMCKHQQKAVICVRYNGKEITVPVGADYKGKYHDYKLRGDKGPFMCIHNFKPLITELYLRRYALDALKKLKAESRGYESYIQICAIGKLIAHFRIEDKTLLELIEASSWCEILVLYPESEAAKVAVLRIESMELQYVLEYLREDYCRRKDESKMERQLSGDYAKSFMTKKNIPKKYVEAMSRSGFNRYFGYVEFDEDCDLALMEELYREYDALAKEIGLPKYEEVSLRFRKLGNHKASGLYYYILKCLCVDVRYPSSMAHEVGHMIDYHMDHISAKYAFLEIADRYGYLLRSYMRSGKDEKQIAILKGNTKYNLDYYLQSTEIFARCFEMYLVRIRKIDNSLCKPADGFAYPNDEILNGLLEKFYDDILKELTEEKAA